MHVRRLLVPLKSVCRALRWMASKNPRLYRERSGKGRTLSLHGYVHLSSKAPVHADRLVCMITTPTRQPRVVATMLLKSGLTQADVAKIKSFSMPTTERRRLCGSQVFQTIYTVINSPSTIRNDGPKEQIFYVGQSLFTTSA